MPVKIYNRRGFPYKVVGTGLAGDCRVRVFNGENTKFKIEVEIDSELMRGNYG